MMPRQQDHRDTIAGFTLIEALVATVLMGLVLAALATITAQWLPNWDRGMINAQRNEQTALALERVSSDLAAAQFISVNRLSRKPLFDGQRDSVIFVRTALGPNFEPGLEIVRIAEVAGEHGSMVVRTRAPFEPTMTRDEPNFTDPVVLLRTPYRLSLSYADPGQNWREDWRDQIQLPNAIRLTIRDAATQRTLSISTATLIHVELPVECLAAKSLAECFTSQLKSSDPRQSDKSRS